MRDLAARLRDDGPAKVKAQPARWSCEGSYHESNASLAWENCRLQIHQERERAEVFRGCQAWLSALKPYDVIEVSGAIVVVEPKIVRAIEELGKDHPFVGLSVRTLGSCATEVYIERAAESEFFEGGLARAIARGEVVCETTATDPLGSSNDGQLNASQSRAVAATAALGKGRAVLIQGPPGTGKTTTLLRCIDAMRSERPLLVCAASNKAVSNVLGAGDFQIKEAVLVGALERVDAKYHRFHYDHRFARLEILECACYDDKSNPAKELAAMLLAAKEDQEEVRRSVAAYVDEFVSSDLMPATDKSATREVAVATITTALEVIRSRRAALLALSFRYVFSTVASVGGRVLRSRRFDIAIVDEACQCREADMLIVLARGVERLVLVGDPMQLEPTVVSEECARAGLGRSMMARLVGLGLVPMLLDTQYRMHPAIVAFPNAEFYEGRLKTVYACASVQRPEYRVVQIAGYSSKLEGGSVSNEQEAKCVLRLLEEVGASNPGATRGVIAPYKAQSELFKSSLVGVDVDVGTVDSFQGQERDIIIFSLTRSRTLDSIGFLRDARRLNVALTRARGVLIVVGDLEFLATQDRHWRALLKDAQRRGKLTEIPTFAALQPCVSRSASQQQGSRRDDIAAAREELERSDAIRATKDFYDVYAEKLGKKNQRLLLGTMKRIVNGDLKKPELRSLKTLHEGQTNTALRVNANGAAIFWTRSTADPSARPYFWFLVPTTEAAEVSKREATLLRHCEHGDVSATLAPQAAAHKWIPFEPSCEALPVETVSKLIYDLSDEQQAVVLREGPLFLQGRGGTGKSEVLFRRMILQIKMKQAKRILFTAQSARLVESFERRMVEQLEVLKIGDPELWAEFERGVVKIDFEVVPELIPRSKLPDDPLVRREIVGEIVGGLAAYKQGSALGLPQYIAQRARGGIPLTEPQKRGVYAAFERARIKFDYELRQEAEYDLVFVDEVQDLPVIAVARLFRRVVDARHVSLGGDTAQTLAGNCAFRFSTVKDLAHELDPTLKPQVEWLTLNYRSTNEVVALSNWVLEMMSTLFPDSFDSGGRREAGGREGEPPLLFVQYAPEDVASLELGSNQAILVCDLGERWAGSKSLVLDAATCKGLQFEDVVLVDCFANLGVKWDQLGRTLRSSRGFDASEHPRVLFALNTLYVLITRASRRLLVFETEQNPFVDEWCRRGLVKRQNGEAAAALASLGDEAKTDWAERGEEFLERKLWPQAKTCFERVGDREMARLVGSVGTRDFFLRSAASSLPKLARQHLLRESVSRLLQRGDVAEQVLAIASALEYGEPSLVAEMDEPLATRFSKEFNKRHGGLVLVLARVLAGLPRTGDAERLVGAAVCETRRDWAKEIGDKKRWAQCEEELGNFKVAAPLYEDLKLYGDAISAFKRCGEFGGVRRCSRSRILRARVEDETARTWLEEAKPHSEWAARILELAASSAEAPRCLSLQDSDADDGSRDSSLWAAKYLLHRGINRRMRLAQAELLHEYGVLDGSRLKRDAPQAQYGGCEDLERLRALCLGLKLHFDEMKLALSTLVARGELRSLKDKPTPRHYVLALEWLYEQARLSESDVVWQRHCDPSLYSSLDDLWCLRRLRYHLQQTEPFDDLTETMLKIALAADGDESSDDEESSDPYFMTATRIAKNNPAECALLAAERLQRLNPSDLKSVLTKHRRLRVSLFDGYASLRRLRALYAAHRLHFDEMKLALVEPGILADLRSKRGSPSHLLLAAEWLLSQERLSTSILEKHVRAGDYQELAELWRVRKLHHHADAGPFDDLTETMLKVALAADDDTFFMTATSIAKITPAECALEAAERLYRLGRLSRSVLMHHRLQLPLFDDYVSLRRLRALYAAHEVQFDEMKLALVEPGVVDKLPARSKRGSPSHLLLAAEWLSSQARLSTSTLEKYIRADDYRELGDLWLVRQLYYHAGGESKPFDDLTEMMLKIALAADGQSSDTYFMTATSILKTTAACALKAAERLHASKKLESWMLTGKRSRLKLEQYKSHQDLCRLRELFVANEVPFDEMSLALLEPSVLALAAKSADHCPVPLIAAEWLEQHGRLDKAALDKATSELKKQPTLGTWRMRLKSLKLSSKQHLSVPRR